MASASVAGSAAFRQIAPWPRHHSWNHAGGARHVGFLSRSYRGLSVGEQIVESIWITITSGDDETSAQPGTHRNLQGVVQPVFRGLPRSLPSSTSGLPPSAAPDRSPADTTSLCLRRES